MPDVEEAEHEAPVSQSQEYTLTQNPQYLWSLLAVEQNMFCNASYFQPCAGCRMIRWSNDLIPNISCNEFFPQLVTVAVDPVVYQKLNYQNENKSHKKCSKCHLTKFSQFQLELLIDAKQSYQTGDIKVTTCCRSQNWSLRLKWAWTDIFVQHEQLGKKSETRMSAGVLKQDPNT